jgi:hypothetical protein
MSYYLADVSFVTGEKSMIRRVAMSACLAVGLVLAGTGPVRAGSAGCSWADLPLPGGARWANVKASDGHGTYLGSSSDGATVLWRGGSVTTIGTGVTAVDVSESGVVVGYRSTGFFSSVPLRWSDGVWQTLSYPDGSSAAASVIARNGDIYGVLGVGRQLIRWPADAPGTYQLLTGPFAGYVDPRGAADDGTLLAYAQVDSTRPHVGLVWHPERGWTELVNPGTGDVQPIAIAGDAIVGYVGDELVQWARDGSVVRTIPRAQPADVNDAGQIVGSDRSGDSLVTTVWRAGQVESVPPLLPGGPVQPVAIDDDGTVVGERPWQGDVPPQPMIARCS